MNHPITIDDVIRFARDNAGKQFQTLARKSAFTLHPSDTGIRFDLPTASCFLINCALIGHYLATYNAEPQERRTKTSIFPSRLRERSYMVRILAEISRLPIVSPDSKADALRDLDNVPNGITAPDRAMTYSLRIERDPAIRRFVITKAAGRCEYCRRLGFRMRNREHYVEAHHIIALADQGRDTIDNVIALCPEHHREAHFGIEAEKLEAEFLLRVKSRSWKRPNK